MSSLQDNADTQLVEEALWNSIIGEIIAEIACEVHREVNLGPWSRSPLSSKFECLCPIETDGNYVQNEQTHDLFGNQLGVTINQTLPCVECGRSVVATRYAPHLEKVGGGNVEGRGERMLIWECFSVWDLGGILVGLLIGG